MKKPFLFLSDFDGTMTQKEFYLVFVENYLEKLDKICLEKVIRGDMTSFEYLNEILSSPNLSEEQIQTHIDELPLVPGIKNLAREISQYRGEFTVVSAGSSYYIKPILEKLNLATGYTLFSNGGAYKDGGIMMSYPEEPFRETYFGIDKGAVFEYLRPLYETIIFAGDGSSDFSAAKQADIVFARDTLAYKLRKAHIDFYPFENFDDILKIVKSVFFSVLPCDF